MWGHKDVCASEGPCIAHLPPSESNVSSQTCSSWYPGKGPQWEHFGWQVAQKGNHPSNALGKLITFVRKGITYVLARSPAATPFANCGPGDIGWVQLAADGTLGCMNAAANCVPWEMCNGFEVAYCKVCKPCPPVYNASFNPGPGCGNCTRPPPPPPPPPPPSPPSPKPGGQPCIRFGNAIASDGVVDATISQDGVTHSWTGYRFSQFSGWVNVFHGGSGTITLKDHASGSTLLTTTIPLTPGPLVVVCKDLWPPKKVTSVETIAASFVPPRNGSAVRLFNLAVDVKMASLQDGNGQTLASNVQYTLGSRWHPVPATQQTFSASASTVSNASSPLGAHVVGAGIGAGILASAPFSPPAAPEVFTAFLMGSASFGYSLLPQIDAPEFGPCRPTNQS